MSEQNAETTPQVEAEVTTSQGLSQDEVNAIVARNTSKAEAKAISGLLSDLGFTNTEELKSTVSAFKDYQESQKTKEQRLAEVESEVEGYKQKATNYEATVKTFLAAEMESVPEAKRGLIPDFEDAAKTLDYIAKNRALLMDQSQPNVSVGTGSSPSAPAVTSPVSLTEFTKMNPLERQKFYKDFPEQAQSLNQQWRTSMDKGF